MMTENTPDTPDFTAADEIAAEALADAGGADAARLTELEDALAKAQQDVLYAQAETQNVRRRAEKDVTDAHAYGVTKFARDILSVSDNLSRALAAIPESAKQDDAIKNLMVGLEATERELTAVLDRNGISRIVAMGQKLDPNQHQAMMEMPSDAEPGTIVQEIQPGYMIKDRLLRPALVAVAKAMDA